MGTQTPSTILESIYDLLPMTLGNTDSKYDSQRELPSNERMLHAAPLRRWGSSGGVIEDDAYPILCTIREQAEYDQ